MSSWSDDVIWWQLHPISFLGAPPEAGPGDAGPGDAGPDDAGPDDAGPGDAGPGDGGTAEPAAAHRLPGLEPWLDYLIELGCNGLALGPVFAAESHGYDTVDYYRIDPRLGSEQDFDRLLDACHRRGVRVLLDGVFHHVGRGFARFQDVLARGRASEYAGWFRLDFEAGGPDGFGYADFEGHQNLVALNHAEPAVVEYVAGVMRHWLDRGADGWRLDAAYAVPVEFWRQVTDRVRSDHPGVWIVGEVIHGDYPAIVAGGGLDSVTQYELWKATWSSLNDGNFYELAWALDRHQAFSRAFRPLTFVGNHDVTRIASRLADERHLPHALTLLFTLPGIPSIYAGDEQAFRGVKYERMDGDTEIRPAFPAGPELLAAEGWPVHRLHRDLIALRRRHRWLVRSSTKIEHLDNQVLAYRALPAQTGSGDGTGLLVLLNLSDQPFTLPMPPDSVRRLLGAPEPGRSGDAGAPADQAEDAGASVEPHGWAVFELRR